ncbi:mediator complex subunit Med5-domain-containing protein [Leucosporidium creatinivorum]|uniref:Mediator of RNA polymerase II transcription subunit 5 n=1 Tax=Leucosporidium creatinivorum TaxID=106004 RepID=A0A1Y2ECP1_9BASI|nr:mediator complex subunit Med5-domain-containing protein [Leucosporidium creatinivorum]
MGPPVDPQKPTVGEVTRACWARALAPASWEALVRQAATAGAFKQPQLENEVCTALLDLLSEASGSKTASPTTLSYLRHAFGLGAPHAVKSLVQPGILAARLWQRSDASLTTIDSALAVVNAALDAQGASAPTYAATSVEGVLEAVAIASSLLASQLEQSASSSSSIQTPTVDYIIRLLSHPPIRITSKDVDDSAIERCLGNLNSASTSLSTFAPLPTDAAFLGQLQQTIASTRSLLDAKPVERIGAPFNLDEKVTSADPDIAFLIDDLLHRSTTPVGISNTRNAVARIAAALKYRVAEAPSRGGTPESALSATFLEMLLAATSVLRQGEGKRVVESSFAYSRLPDVLSDVFRKISMSDKCQEGLQGGLESAMRAFASAIKTPSSNAMDLDDATSATSPSTIVLNTLITSFCHRELISIDVGASLASPDVHQQDLAPQSLPEGCYNNQLAEQDQEGVRETLNDLPTNYLAQKAIVSGLQAAIHSFAQNLDLVGLSALCKTILDVPDVLEVAFLHLEPREILSPVREFLDQFDTSLENFGDGHPIEGYGKVVLFIETVLSRFKLYADLPRHLGSSKGFFVHWLPSAPAVYPLQGLDEESKLAVDGWVEGLFGEGISDELMHSTNPRVLLRVAPTICKQSLVACQAGVIDLDTLREGLSYFLQELLSFTLPGVVHWLVDEIGRTPPSPAQTTMLDILGVFIFSESLPRLVLELVSSSLAALASKLGNTSPAPTLDLAKLKALVAPYQPVLGASASSTSPASWSTQLTTALPRALATPSSAPPPPSLSAALLHTSPSPSSLLATLLALHQPLLPSASPEPYLRASRLLRLSSALLATPSSTSSTFTFPILQSLITEVLPWRLLELAARGEDEEALAQGELLGEILAAPLLWANEMVVEGGEGVSEQESQVAVLLDGVAWAVRDARRRTEGKKGAAEGEQRRRGAEAFVDRLMAHQVLVDRSAKLAQLRAI